MMACIFSRFEIGESEVEVGPVELGISGESVDALFTFVSEAPLDGSSPYRVGVPTTEVF
jgi:hypothetical protein